MEATVERFETASDAVVNGDVATLNAMLQLEPELITARSFRDHHATLLHYCAANGVEQERQKTPPNVFEVVRLLVAAGADPNATADIFGEGATTLALAATSIHPLKAGVQQALLETLLDSGAEIRPGDVLACLMNGREAAASFLTARGADLGAAEAAGLGWMVLLREFVAAGVVSDDLELGFLLACEFGHDAVIEYLATVGVNLQATTRDGQTGLHMAAIGGRAKTASLLLCLGLSTSAKNVYGGTPLGQAIWSAENSSDTARYRQVIAVLQAANEITR